MGCHTWFYKKSNRSIEEARKIFIDQTIETIEFYKNVIDNDMQFEGVDWREWEKDGPGVGFIENFIKVLYRQIRMVEKGLCNLAVYNKQPEISFVNEKGFFVEHSDYHDVFRKHGYPEDILYSFDETIDYINNPDNHCTKNDLTEERLKEFWKECPDGAIEFG